MKRFCVWLSALCLLNSLTFSALAEGETEASSGPVMLPGMTPLLAVVAGMAIAVSLIGWWNNRNHDDRHL